MSDSALQSQISTLKSKIASMFSHPLVVKEFRTHFRRWRFVLWHVFILALLYMAMLIYILDIRDASWTTLSRYGNDLFGVFALGLAIGISILLIPLASLTIITEKEKMTYELLVSTTISPASIVWGKFLSCMGYAVVYILTSLPFAIIPFFIGGITLDLILVYYFWLLVWAALVSIAGIYMSSVARNLAFAIIGGFVLVGGVAFYLGGGISALGELWRGIIYRAFNEGGVGADQLPSFIWHMFLWLLFMSASLFSVFFICAVNQVKPSFANKSTPLRVFYTLFILGFCLLSFCYSSFFEESHQYYEGYYIRNRSSALGSDFLEFISISLFILMTLSTLLAAENPFVSVRVAAERNRLTGPLRWRRVFYPGSHMGVVFCAAINGVVLAICVCLTYAQFQASAHDREIFLKICMGALVFVVSMAAFNYFVSTWFQERIRGTMVLWVLYGAVLMSLPFIYAAINEVKLKRYVRDGLDLPFFVSTSPIPFWETRYTTPSYFGQFLLIHLILATVFLSLGLLRERRLNRRRTSMLVRGILEQPT